MKKRTIISIPVLLWIIIPVYIIFIKPNLYMFNGGDVYLEPAESKRFTNENFISVLGHDSGVYICSEDGLEKLDIKGDIIWSKPFKMTSPKMKKQGKYIMVVDILGRQVFLFDDKGYILSINESEPIIDFAINKSAYMTLVMQNEDKNTIHLYDSKGDLIIERVSIFEQDGYPLAVDLSSNSLNLATSYANISSGQLKTNITLFSFDEIHDDMEEFIIAGDSFEDVLIADIHYFDNDYLWCIGDNKLYFYKMARTKAVYDRVKEIPIKGHIKQIAFTNNEVIIYLENKDLSQAPNSILVYSKSGKLLDKIDFGQEIKLLKAEGDHYFIITETEIIKMNKTRRIWISKTYRDLFDIHQINSRKYITIGRGGYEIVNLKEN